MGLTYKKGEEFKVTTDDITKGLMLGLTLINMLIKDITIKQDFKEKLGLADLTDKEIEKKARKAIIRAADAVEELAWIKETLDSKAGPPCVNCSFLSKEKNACEFYFRMYKALAEPTFFPTNNMKPKYPKDCFVLKGTKKEINLYIGNINELAKKFKDECEELALKKDWVDLLEAEIGLKSWWRA